MTESDVRVAFKEHGEAVFRFSWRMTNSPSAAEDITQDVFLFLLRRPGQFDPQRGQLRAFLIGVARNLARKWLVRESRWTELEDEQFIAEPVKTEGREIAASVGVAVWALPATQRSFVCR